MRARTPSRLRLPGSPSSPGRSPELAGVSGDASVGVSAYASAFTSAYLSAYMSAYISAIAILVLSLVTACATPLHEGRWVVAQTSNFELLTTLDRFEAVRLAEELESFHAFVAQVTNFSEAPASTPTRVIAIARPTQYGELGEIGSDGYFSFDLRSNLMVSLAPRVRRRVSERVLHQYAHARLRGASMRPLPSWYEEGMAALLSGIRIRGAEVEIGALPWTMASELGYRDWVSVDELISRTPGPDATSEDRARYAAQSWALVHYLLLDRKIGWSAIAPQVDRYVDLIDLGTSPSTAYRIAFGESTTTSDRKLRSVLRKGKIGGVQYSAANLGVGSSRHLPDLRVPTRSEVATGLGELALRRGDLERAQVLYEAAIAADPESARSHAGLGNTLRAAERFDEALRSLDHAARLDSQDPEVLLDLGAYHAEQAGQATELERHRRELAAARKLFERALEQAPGDPEALAGLGELDLVPGEPAERALLELSDAFARQPASATLAASLAEAHLVQGDALVARELLLRTSSICEKHEQRGDVPATIAELERRRSLETARIRGLEAKAAGLP